MTSTVSPASVTEHVTVYHESGYYCGPGPAVVCEPHTGRLTVAFRRVPSWLHEGLSGHWHPATELCLTHSEDYGASWSPPQVFQAGGQCPNLRRLHDGTLLAHTHRFELVNNSIHDAIRSRWPQDTAGLVENHWPGVQRGTGVWRSSDGGITWGEPAWLKGAPGVDALHPTLAPALAVRGNVLQTSSGRLLVSAYSFGVDNVSHLFGSDDDGRSWDWCATIASDSNETCLHETDAGDIVAFLRRHQQMDVLYMSRSRDGGSSWSALEPVCQGYPACTARLPSGRVLLTYGYRFDPGYGVRARVLDVDARGAESAPEIVLRDDGVVSDLGYPDAVALPDGRVFVVYYHNSRADLPAFGEAAHTPRHIAGCFVTEAG